MILQKSYYIMIAILAFTLLSCNNKTVFHQYQPIDSNGWLTEDTLYFVLPDSMPNGKYHTEIGIRHTEVYPYKDLWLATKSDGNNKADTFHIYLANDRGNWNSSGTTGGFFQYSIPTSDLNYSHSRDSIIKIYHIMKDSPLNGITDIGLKITRD